jgi:hypothetical protein
VEKILVVRKNCKIKMQGKEIHRKGCGRIDGMKRTNPSQIKLSMNVFLELR